MKCTWIGAMPGKLAFRNWLLENDSKYFEKRINDDLTLFFMKLFHGMKLHVFLVPKQVAKRCP